MEFSSKRLNYRLLEEQDRAFFIALYQDPKVMRKIAPVLTQEEAEVAFKHSCQLNKAESYKQKIWVVIEKKKEEVCGILMGKWRNKNANAELGVMLKPVSNGKELATEAVGELINFASRTMFTKSFEAEFASEHIPVRRILTKLGFSFHQPGHGENSHVRATLKVE